MEDYLWIICFLTQSYPKTSNIHSHICLTLLSKGTYTVYFLSVCVLSCLWMPSRYNVMIIGLTVCAAHCLPMHCFSIGLNEIQYGSQICEDAQPSTKTLPRICRERPMFPINAHTYIKATGYSCRLGLWNGYKWTGGERGRHRSVWALRVCQRLQQLLFYLLMWNSSTTMASVSQLKLMINTPASGRFDSNSQQCRLQRCRDASGRIEGEKGREITQPAAETKALLWVQQDYAQRC